MVKTIRNLFESFEKAKTGSDFLALLKDATAFVKNIPPPPEGETDHSVQLLIDWDPKKIKTEEEEVKPKKNELEILQEQYDKLILEKKSEIEAVKAKFDTDNVIEKPDQEAIVSTSIFKRPLKFQGVISDANMPNCLSFISLIRQTDTTLTKTKKYTEAEVI